MKNISIVVLSLLIGGSLSLISASENGGMKCGSSMGDKKSDKKDVKYLDDKEHSNHSEDKGHSSHKDEKKSSMKCGSSHMKSNGGKCGSM